jgi:RND superfamily putative drug exporter
MRIDAIFGAIGRAAVRFRWLVVLVWIAAAFGAVTQLPSLASVTNNNNSTFLPASAPSEHAAVLAAPLGTANLFGIPVVAARSGAPLTPADVTALAALQHQLGTVPGVSRVQDLGRSPDGQAVQLQVLAQASGGNQSQQTDLVDGLRAKIAGAGLPAGLQVHLAGDIAVSVDQQKASGNTGGQVQDFSALFIIVLLVLIFRSLTLALTTLAPAFISVLISGPLVGEAAKHGLQVSPLAQFLLIVLVLGAGTDYGLFLVFRVREELRAVPHGTQGDSYPGSRSVPGSMLGDLIHARRPAADAIVRSVTRVGESITFSAATVIAAVLRPRRPVRDRHRRHPGRRADLAARAAVDPPVAAGRQAHPVPGHVRQAEAAAVEHPGQRQVGRVGPGRRARRAAPGADAARRGCRLRRAGGGCHRLHGGRVRR